MLHYLRIECQHDPVHPPSLPQSGEAQTFPEPFALRTEAASIIHTRFHTYYIRPYLSSKSKFEYLTMGDLAVNP